MLYKKYDSISGKVLKQEKPLLLNASKGYIRPEEYGSVWWLTTTSIWNCDELILRKIRDWRRLTNETGHDGARTKTMRTDHDSMYTGTHSVFPAPLAEWIILRYAGPEGGVICDAFAGGPPRGMVAGLMRYKYIGYDIRQEQIDESRIAIKNLGLDNCIDYVCGDGVLLNNTPDSSCDFGFTCPPYFNLEVYSDLPNDLSNLPDYSKFIDAISNCAKSYFRVVKPNAFVCIITSSFRIKNTQGVNELVDFPGHTIEAFRRAGFSFWQDVVLSRNFASAAGRSTTSWRGKKLIPRHERLLVFRKT
jgi:DNA modification methylase